MGRRKPDTLVPIELAIMKRLAKAPSHGIAIADELERSSRTVYAALERLEGMGYVRSRWQSPKAKGERPRRVYTITAKGRKALKA